MGLRAVGGWVPKTRVGHTVPALPFLSLVAYASRGFRTVFSTHPPAARSKIPANS